MAGLSAIIITFNEERNIERCLRSLAFADEIVVVDSGSEDKTREVASAYTDRIMTRPWTGYASQRNFAIEQARGSWVLWVDADEEITAGLGREIETLLAGTPSHAGYTAPRVCRFMGRWIRHGNWYPDRSVRLFARDRARFAERAVHESLRVEGSIGRLEGEILHYSYPDLDEYVRKLNRYSSLDAEEKLKEGKGVGPVDLVVSPAAVFFKSYFIKMGFLDGVPGLAAGVLSAVYVFVKKLKLLEKTWNRKSSSGP